MKRLYKNSEWTNLGFLGWEDECGGYFNVYIVDSRKYIVESGKLWVLLLKVNFCKKNGLFV